MPGCPYPGGLGVPSGDMFVRRNLIDTTRRHAWTTGSTFGLRCDAHRPASSITVAWASRTQGRLLVTGEVVNVYVDVRTRVPAGRAQGMRDQLDGLRQWGGASTVSSLGNWSTFARPVLWPCAGPCSLTSRGIPEAEEWDADDC